VVTIRVEALTHVADGDDAPVRSLERTVLSPKTAGGERRDRLIVITASLYRRDDPCRR
jgi:hypothetical protein